MSYLLKDIYNHRFFNTLTAAIKHAVPLFSKNTFLTLIHNEHWDEMALKQRMKHIAITLHTVLNGTYTEKLQQVYKIIEACRANGAKDQTLEYMFFPEFIALYGMGDIGSSMKAIELVTAFASCEYAIRPFLATYPQETMAQMFKWSTHPNPNVRRFASEGCRPRLPWGQAIASLKKDPAPIFPILENLKNDASEYVRRSVANNLNDIAKDHPGLVVQLATRWKGMSKETDWIIKHGCRTLLRKANKESLVLWGLSDAPDCGIEKLELKRGTISVGEYLEFAFELVVFDLQPVKLRIEYGLDYVKANGKHSRKLFKITEALYDNSRKYPFKRKQSFSDMTTRKHYAGEHTLTVVVNGREMASRKFTVVKPPG